MIRAFLIGVLLLVFTATLSVFTVLVSLVSRKRGASAIMRFWARGILFLCGVKTHVTGLEHIDTSIPSIYLANHASYYDIPLLMATLPVDLRFIYKKSLGYIPFLGWTMHASGMIGIDREDRTNALQGLRTAGRQIRKGFHVLIFPEGTRTRNGELGKFKKGGFLLALQEHLDIVPITIQNSRKIAGRGAIVATPGTVGVRIHSRIPMADATLRDRKAIMAQVRESIETDLLGTDE